MDSSQSYYTQPPQPATPAPNPAPPSRSEGFRNIASTVAVLLLAPLVALFLTSLVFQSYQVDGPSMETTLQHSDRLIVWKLPRSWARLTGHQYVPKRGDVIIFGAREAAELGQISDKQLIKRVIALPGERVVVKDNVVTVYNDDHPSGFSPDKTLPYGKVITTTEGNGDWTLGDNEIFVCGDNRGNSLDSRSFGPITTDDIVGKLALRVLPLNKAERF